MKKLNLIKKTGCCSSTIDINEDDIDMEFFDNIDKKELMESNNDIILIKTTGEFRKKAIYLNDRYDYILGYDNTNDIILVPLKKK